LEKLVNEASVGNRENGKKKILLVLDNAKYHHAKILQPWIESVSNILELFFLPPYSPDLSLYGSIFNVPNNELTNLTAFI
jgi:transposase